MLDPKPLTLEAEESAVNKFEEARISVSAVSTRKLRECAYVLTFVAEVGSDRGGRTGMLVDRAGEGELHPLLLP